MKLNELVFFALLSGEFMEKTLSYKNESQCRDNRLTRLHSSINNTGGGWPFDSAGPAL